VPFIVVFSLNLQRIQKSLGISQGSTLVKQITTAESHLADFTWNPLLKQLFEIFLTVCVILKSFS
jgi:hypothetical protein